MCLSEKRHSWIVRCHYLLLANLCVSSIPMLSENSDQKRMNTINVSMQVILVIKILSSCHRRKCVRAAGHIDVNLIVLAIDYRFDQQFCCVPKTDWDVVVYAVELLFILVKIARIYSPIHPLITVTAVYCERCLCRLYNATHTHKLSHNQWNNY